MPSNRWLRILAVVPVCVALSTCSHDTSGPPAPTPAAMALVSGGGQTAIAGQALAARLFVLVTAASGVPVPGVRVQWTVTAGSGSVTSASVNTDGQGKASVAWTLGVRAGQPQTATASVTGLSGSPVTFSATAVPGPPASVTPSAGDSQTVIAGNAVTTAPAVIVKDINANPVPQVAVTFAVATGGGAITGASATTDANGIATVGSWTSGTVAGRNTLTATAAALPAYTFTSTGVPGPPASIAVSAGDAQTAVAGATLATAPAVLVKDVNANPVPNVAVAFTVTAGSGTLTGANATTDANGIATVTSWRLGTTAGANALSATVSVASVNPPPTVPFTATGVAGAAASVTPSAGTGQSATVNTAVATAPAVVVQDANGNVIAAVAVTFAVASGGGALTAGGATTDANGIAAVGSWTLGTAAGTNTLTATVTGLTAATFTATGTAGSAASVAPSAGDGQSAVAGQVVVTAPAAIVKDGFGNPVAGVTVTFAVASGGGTLGGSATATTAANGVAQAGSWTLGTTAGANTVTATVSGFPAVTFTATGTAGAPTSLAASAGGGQSAVAGSAVATPPAVVVRDVNGNGVPGVTVTFAVLTGGGSATGSPAATDANGIARVGSWTLGTTAGNNGLGASVPGLTPVNFSATGVAGPPATVVAFAGSGQSATAGSSVTVNPAVSVRDVNGNAVAGISVVFAVTAGGGSVGGAGATTGATGVASVTGWQLGTLAGTNTIAATVSGLAPVTFTATGTPGSPATLEVLAGDGQNATVGATLNPTPSLIVRDANNNAVPGVTVTFAVVTGGGSTAGDIVATDASGVATLGSWALGSVAGTNTLTATVSGFSLTFTATGTVAEAAAVDVSAGNNQSATVNAAVATAPAVVVRDAFGNPKAGVAVTFAVASGGGSVLGASTTSNASGIATAQSWTLGTVAGANTLTATVAGLSAATFTATGTAGGASSVAVQAGDAQSAVAGAAVAIAPEVVVRDAFGNPVAGVPVAFAVTSGLGSVAGGAATTNGSGVARVTTWTLGAAAGPNTLTATATGGGIGGNPVTFTATATFGAPATMTVNDGAGQSAIAGSRVATRPSVLVRDASTNPVPNVAVSFVVASGGGSVTGGSATTDASGIAQVGSWTLGNLVGTNTLEAVASGLTTVTFTATGQVGLPASIALSAGSGQVAQAATAVAVPPVFIVRDGNGNPVPNISVSFVASGDGSVTPPAALTNVNGLVAPTTWTLTTTAPDTNILTATTGVLTPATVTAVATAGVPGTVQIFAGDLQLATVGTAVGALVRVRIVDNLGNPVTTGVSVTFAVAPGVGSVIGPQPVTSNDSGVATLGGWILGTSVGSNTLTATVAGLSPAIFTATGTAGPPASVAVSAGNNQTAVAGAAVATSPTALVLDANDNPVPGATVSWTVTAGGGSPSAPTSPTDASGLATITWTLGTTAGANGLSAAVSGVPTPAVFAATGIAGAPASIAVNTVSGQSATVNTAVATPPAVLVKDANDNPVPNATVTFAVASGGGAITGAVATTNGAGIAAVGSWSLGTVVGPNALTATAAGAGVAGNPATFAATGTPGAPATITVSAGDNQTATVNTSVATPPTAVVRDQFGNVVPGVTVTFAVASGAGSVIAAVDTTDAAGLAAPASWTLGTVAGANTLGATVTGLAALTFTATGTAGAAATVAINAGNKQIEAPGEELAVPPSVVVRDAFSNPVQGAPVNFNVLTGGGVLRDPAQITGPAGIATVGSWTLGTTIELNRLQAASGALTPVVFTASGANSFVHSCTIASSGATLCWGRNKSGQLGDGTTTDQSSPVAVSGAPALAAVTAGGVHTCGLTSAGTAYCWGSDLDGQLGDGLALVRSTAPKLVEGGLTFSAISGGLFHTCGLTTGGAAYCWGRNSSGQLGDSTLVSQSAPVAVVGGHTFTAIAAGANHTCGVESGGQVYCWGANKWGQIGDNSTTGVAYPVAVVGATGFTAVSAGGGHSCGVDAAGAAWCWGNSLFGQLGNGQTTNRSTPTQVSGGETYANVTLGFYHTCGITTAGSTQCWGRNESGQVGDGGIGNRPVPSPVAGGNTFVGVALGAFHTCGRTPAGATFCWGVNTFGQVGDGTTVARSTPVLVVP